MNDKANEKESAIVDWAVYVDGQRQTSGPSDYAEAFHQIKDQHNAFLWLGMLNPTADEVRHAATVFALGELAIDEASATEQRPKLAQHGELTLAVLKTARYVKEGEITATSEIVETGHIVVIFRPHFVLTVRQGQPGNLHTVRTQLESQPQRLAQGTWAVLHAIMDATVDSYGEVVDAFEEDIDDVESSVFSRRASDVQRIYQLKRELVEFKRAVLPLTRPLENAASGYVTQVPEKLRRHFADVVDHQHRIVEQVASYDDLLTSILQASLTQTSIQQNSDMRKISAWAAIVAVQTTIAGIYGMNFRHMPELRWTFGYPLVLVVMVGIALVLYRAFRRSGWL